MNTRPTDLQRRLYHSGNPNEITGGIQMSVVFFTNDLLFSSRVTSVATQRSIELSVLSDADELVERASIVPVKVILLDLGTSGLDPAHLVPQLRKLTPPPRAIIAFGPRPRGGIGCRQGCWLRPGVLTRRVQ